VANVSDAEIVSVMTILKAENMQRETTMALWLKSVAHWLEVANQWRKYHQNL
jgi:hypothetical protein